jgi:hypothetical protein
MRNKSFAALGTLALLAAASAFGQQRVGVDIPFEFGLGNKVMPAGHYDVTQTSGLVLVRCYTRGVAAFAQANNLGGGTNEISQSRLIFNKYGDKYFLAEVWVSPRTAYGAGLSKSKTEREIARTSPDVARVTVPVRTGAVTLASVR